MNIRLHTANALAVFLSLSFLLPSVLAQTAPAPTTTFTANSGNAWTTVANWDVQVPTSSDDALIGPAQTATVTSTELDAAPFGTLTLGSGSTLQLSAAGKTGLPSGKTVYFSNGSYLQFTAGDINRAANYNVLAGATASFKPGNANSDTIVSGSATGAVDSVLNIDINNVTFFRTRWSNAGFAGTMNYTSASNQREVDLSSHATANTAVGPGITTFGNNVRVTLGSANRMSDSATVKFVGAAGGNNIKFNGGVDRSDTIANLTIESPIAASTAAYIYTRNGWLKVTGSVSFTGTAGTVKSDTYSTTTYPGGIDARGADITFGIGSWALTGNGILWLDSSSTISNTTDVTLSCSAKMTSGTLNKYGAGTLTLDGDLSLFFPSTINIHAGSMSVATNVDAMALTAVSLNGVIGDSFTAQYDPVSGTFENIGQVSAELGPGKFFQKGIAADGFLKATDNGTSFMVALAPPGGTILVIR